MAAQASETFEGSLPISNIFRIVGGWGGVSGPGVFMLRCIVVGSGAGAVMGMACASIGAMLTGVGTLPFAIGACIGFTGSVMSHYFTSLRQAYIALERYPSLMLLHLHANYPDFMEDEFRRNGPMVPVSNYQRLEIEGGGGNVSQVGLTVRQRIERSWRMRSMLIIAWMTAGSALDEIHSHSEAFLVEKYAEERKAAEEARLELAVSKMRSE